MTHTPATHSVVYLQARLAYLCAAYLKQVQD